MSVNVCTGDIMSVCACMLSSMTPANTTPNAPPVGLPSRGRKPLAQIVRDRYAEILEWRQQRISWDAVHGFVMEGEAQPWSVASLQKTFGRESARRMTEKRLKVLLWIEERHDEIQYFRDRGYDWPTVIGLASRGSMLPAGLSLILTEISLLSPVWNPKGLPETAQNRTEETSPAASPLLSEHDVDTDSVPSRPLTLREARARDRAIQAETNADVSFSSLPQPPSPDTLNPDRGHDHGAHTQKRDAPVPLFPTGPAAPDPPSAPKSRAMRKLHTKQQEQDREKAAEDTERAAREAERLAYIPNNYPYISGAQYQVELESVRQHLWALPSPDADTPPDLAKQQQSDIEAARDRRNRLREDFFTRHCHPKAKRSVLAILSTAALSSGAFRVADENETVSLLGYDRSAIKLLGYDRPERIEDVTEIPDPLFIIENLAPDDLSRLERAYSTDNAECPVFDHSAATDRRRLAEAAALRGAYTSRDHGWCAYDDFVKLSGDDFPSPSLLSDTDQVVRTVDRYLDSLDKGHAPLVRLAPKLIGNEPDWDRLKPWDRDKVKDSSGGWLDKGYGD